MLKGEIPVGRPVFLAVERHIADLKGGKDRGLRFDGDEAFHAVQFFEQFLCLAEGDYAGKPFLLEPWQQFILANIFGWKAADGYRRFRTAYIEIGKGNGKSPLAAGIGLYGLLADGESAGEIYSAAVVKDQAKILFRDAENMRDASPMLTSRIDKHINNLSVEATNSFFRPISSEKRGLDGKRAHMALIDEIHEHPSATVVDKMRAGTKGRRQALIFEITNSGYDRHSVCYHHHEFSEKVLEGLIQNDSWFAYVAQLDACEKCRDEGKTSPNCEHCDQCYAGMDLANVSDLAAFVLLFPDDGKYKVLPFFWIPQETARVRSEKDRVPYDQWIKDGLIKATEGDVIDYDVIRREINELADVYDIREIAFDPWNSSQIVTQLTNDGFTMAEIRQGFQSLSAPTKELEKLVRGGDLIHGGNPVLRWNASNVSVHTDPSGNIKPDKERSTEKIDGISALVNAIARVIRVESPSVYASRGVRTIEW